MFYLIKQHCDAGVNNYFVKVQWRLCVRYRRDPEEGHLLRLRKNRPLVIARFLRKPFVLKPPIILSEYHKPLRKSCSRVMNSNVKLRPRKIQL